MKKYTDLKELLEQYQIWLIKNELLGSNAYYNAEMYLRSNSLALGKPEPLAKNKQSFKLIKLWVKYLNSKETDLKRLKKKRSLKK